MVQGILGERSIKVVGGGGLGSKFTFFSSLRYFDILHMVDQMLFTEFKNLYSFSRYLFSK